MVFQTMWTFKSKPKLLRLSMVVPLRYIVPIQTHTHTKTTRQGWKCTLIFARFFDCYANYLSRTHRSVPQPTTAAATAWGA